MEPSPYNQLTKGKERPGDAPRLSRRLQKNSKRS